MHAIQETIEELKEGMSDDMYNKLCMATKRAHAEIENKEALFKITYTTMTVSLHTYSPHDDEEPAPDDDEESEIISLAPSAPKKETRIFQGKPYPYMTDNVSRVIDFQHGNVPTRSMLQKNCLDYGFEEGITLINNFSSKKCTHIYTIIKIESFANKSQRAIV